MPVRVKTVMITTVFVFVSLFGRLYSLTSDELRTVAVAESSRTQTLFVSRGTIYDRYLRPLVNEQSQWVCSAYPYDAWLGGEHRLSPEQQQAVRDAIEQRHRAVFFGDHALPEEEGLVQFEVPVRYAKEPIASHVIGYVDGEGNGVSGVELGYNEELVSFRGEVGVSYSIDALGRPASRVPDKQWNTTPLSVGGIFLTLDRDIQMCAESLARDYLESGAVLVSDVHSGQMLACVSVPGFDPDAPEESLHDARSPMMDRTLCNYNIGSVFKVLVAAAALERGIGEEWTAQCHGRCEVGDIVFSCRDHGADHPLTMREALAVSCNTYFIRLAQELGETVLLDAIQRAGWQNALSVAKGIRTATPVSPSAEELKAQAALANTAIGQGVLTASIYHVHSLMAAVANGGVWCEPTLYAGAVDSLGRAVETEHQPRRTILFSEQTADQLRMMLEGVVSNGTGVSAQPQNGTAAGKTGTAETGWIIDGDAAVQSWFSGVYPSDSPQYVITVLSENGGTNGRTAAPLFAAVADALFETGLVEISQELY